MQVKSIAVTDYSTGTQYVYSGSSGTWESIQAVGGKVNSGGGKVVTPVDPAPPTITGANSAPMPFGGTHRDTSSTYVTPDIYPWVATTLKKSPVATVTTYPGLPSGWTVTDTGKVLPPSAAPVRELPSYSCALSCLLVQPANSYSDSKPPNSLYLPHCLQHRGRILSWGAVVPLKHFRVLTKRDSPSPLLARFPKRQLQNTITSKVFL